MYDRDAIRQALQRLSPVECGVVAAVASARFFPLVGVEPTAEEARDAAQLIVRASQLLARSCEALELQFEPGLLRSEFLRILGPDDDPFEQYDGLSSWYFDILSIFDYAIRAWENPGVASANCIEVLLASYSLAGALEDALDEPVGTDFCSAEFGRQIADVEAMANSSLGPAGQRVAYLFREAATLSEVYERRFGAIRDSY